MTDGFLNVLKPPGMSSHDVVNAVRKILKEKKVGHAGTLDPAAAGVLPIAVGRATRLLEYLSLSNKNYRGEILLGKSTVSGDLSSEVTKICDADFPSDEKILEVLNRFKGKILQKPPAVSALQINGRRAYDLARRGEEFEIPLREVEIFSIELLKTYPERKSFLMDAEVSKGTYIRSLAVDIGEKLNLPAVLKFLLRTKVGDFSINNARTFEELETMGESAILKPDLYLSHISRYELPKHRKKAFMNGLSTSEKKSLPELLTVFCDGEFLGIARHKNGEVTPVKVYAT